MALKTTNALKADLARAAILAVLLFSNQAALAQGTAFTYQARLVENGSPANGNYDMQFILFNMLTAGTQQASFTNPSVTVTNGSFTVQLDFGVCATCFDGSGRFLEIGVRPSGSPNAYTVLAPRQQVTSNPYAIRSLNATTSDNATQLNGMSAGGFIQNTTMQQAGTNFNIGGNGTLGGNLIANGSVGIGNNSPNFGLDVEKATGHTYAKFGTQFPLYAVADFPSLGFNTYFNGAWKFGKGSTSHFGAMIDVSPVDGGMHFYTTNNGAADATATLAEQMRITQSGNVGIGTTTPTGKLQVATTNDTAPGTITAWDSRHFVIGAPASSGTLSGGIGLSYSLNNEVGYLEALSPNLAWRPLVLQSGGGNVGIGIGTTIPLARLAVRGNGTDVLIGDVGCSSPTAAIGFGSLSACANFAMGANPSVNETIINRPSGGYISFREGNGTDQMRLISGGNVGIGTTSPAGLLHVKGESPVRILGDPSTLLGTEYVDFMAYSSQFSSNLGGMRIQRQGNGDIDTVLLAAASGSSATEKMRVSGNGTVAVNALQINGALRVSGAGANTPTTAFIHTATANNKCGGTTTIIDNPYSNGDPNAILIVTPSINTLDPNRHQVEGYIFLTYGDMQVGCAAGPPGPSNGYQHWMINCNPGGNISCIPVSASFNVLVIKP
ncbi:MAG TPA: hypothetical protein VNO24_03025 [Blastocatellia bacterium]|nr:hypothetical protein [Blastocatellia bacterium]